MSNKIFSLAILMMTAVLAHAQSDGITQFFSKYETDPSFTLVSVSGKMFTLFTHIEGKTEEEKEMLKTISKLKGLRFLVNEEATNSKATYQAAVKTKMMGFELMMSVQDAEENLSFFIKEQTGVVKELIMIGESSGEFFIMSITGDIDLNQLSKLARVVNIEGMEKLENLKK
ncbi:MAG: DUF4252 domain-containing protein [Flavobacteriales bacterium]|nr:DUF4252 domain-containing protein [Flavobacteriales bacterium]